MHLRKVGRQVLQLLQAMLHVGCLAPGGSCSYSFQVRWLMRLQNHQTHSACLLSDSVTVLHLTDMSCECSTEPLLG